MNLKLLNSFYEAVEQLRLERARKGEDGAWPALFALTGALQTELKGASNL